MKILLVNLSFLGDTILSTPVIAGLKQIFPNSELSFLTTQLSSSLLQNDPCIDKIIVYDKRNIDKGFKGLFKKAAQLKKENFDIVYSLHRSHRTAVLLLLAKIPKRVGFKDASLSFLYTEKRKKTLDAHAAIRNLSLLFKDVPEQELKNKNLRLFEPLYNDLSKIVKNLNNNFIVMAPGSAWKTKQWHWQGYLKVAEYYKSRGRDIILIGSKEDTAICNKISKKVDVIDVSGKIPLSDTLYIVKNAKLLVCNDSMSLHMGSAFKTPTVVIFCATSPEFGFGPWLNHDARIVQDETLGCKPCRRHGSKSCPNKTEMCMQLDAAKVLLTCEELLDGK